MSSYEDEFVKKLIKENEKLKDRLMLIINLLRREEHMSDRVLDYIDKLREELEER